ncbi:hypothetical protein RRG08_015888 [Elysia crispata]|uniref:Uncharacterized protein n=1 Tax=Elysia crispata TaxID=231223 RepID=A0AAE1AMJ2_9GAST|nr:hypothetical protein RRG08_015888 [Elysia crispata]
MRFTETTEIRRRKSPGTWSSLIPDKGLWTQSYGMCEPKLKGPREAHGKLHKLELDLLVLNQEATGQEFTFVFQRPASERSWVKLPPSPQKQAMELSFEARGHQGSEKTATYLQDACF